MASIHITSVWLRLFLIANRIFAHYFCVAAITLFVYARIRLGAISKAGSGQFIDHAVHSTISIPQWVFRDHGSSVMMVADIRFECLKPCEGCSIGTHESFR